MERKKAADSSKKPKEALKWGRRKREKATRTGTWNGSLKTRDLFIGSSRTQTHVHAGESFEGPKRSMNVQLGESTGPTVRKTRQGSLFGIWATIIMIKDNCSPFQPSYTRPGLFRAAGTQGVTPSLMRPSSSCKRWAQPLSPISSARRAISSSL